MCKFAYIAFNEQRNVYEMITFIITLFREFHHHRADQNQWTVQDT